MDQRERLNSFPEALLAALDGRQAQIWTALPCIIQSFNANALTVVAQPAIKAQVRSPNGTMQWVALPLLLDCPVVFPRGGGCTLTFPIAAGDECLIIFASRCIDAWWTAGGTQVQSELRMHDLSDGFAIPGPFSQATKISNVSATAVQLRSNDGQAYVQLNPATHNIDVNTVGNLSATVQGFISNNSPSVMDLNAPTVNVTNAFMAGNGASGTIVDVNGRVVTFQAGICTDIS